MIEYKDINDQSKKQIEINRYIKYGRNTRILRTISLNTRQQSVPVYKIRRVHFSFYELNNENGNFQVVKTIRILMIQIINIKSDDHIYLKVSLRMKFCVAHNEIVQ